MAITTPSLTVGQALYEGTQSWRDKDDAADNRVNGVYSHKAIEFSGTEATEWIGFFMYISALVATIKTEVDESIGPNKTVTIKQIMKGGAVTAAGAASLYNFQSFR